MATSNTVDRLHKRIANAGVCSRRAAEEMIRQGRVEVNGKVVTEMGVKVGPDDVVSVDGRPLHTAKLTYILMNKPAGYLTTMSDPHRRPTVLKLLPRLDVVVKPCGRLDQDTEGLLIFTNDGLFAQRITHPRYAVEKEYVAVVEGIPTEDTLKTLREGVYIEGGKTAPAQVNVDYVAEPKRETHLRIVIHEGRKRQVRQMCETLGHPVKSLRRVRIGPIVLHKLPRGACRLLSMVEVEKLKKLIGMSDDSPAEPIAVPRRAAAPKRRPKPSA
jgi:23S rRNA pseudouridine2605 synthase